MDTLQNSVNNIVLTCINPKSAHWGEILIPGVEYSGVVVFKPTEIITDYDNYWKHTSLQSSSIEWIRKGYTEETLPQVIPGYISISEKNRLYSKRIDMPFFETICSDGQKNYFCLLSDIELYSLGAAKGKAGRSLGKPCFAYSVYRVDDYFDYTKIRRESRLNKILE